MHFVTRVMPIDDIRAKNRTDRNYSTNHIKCKLRQYSNLWPRGSTLVDKSDYKKLGVHVHCSQCAAGLIITVHLHYFSEL